MLLMRKEHILTMHSSLIRLKEWLHLWMSRSISQVLTLKSRPQISFRLRTYNLHQGVQRLIIEIELIRSRKILVDLIILDFRLILLSFQKHWKECWSVLLLLSRTRKRRLQYKADRDEILLRENELVQRKEILYQIL